MLRGGHVTLFVRNLRLAERFYVETLGMKLVAETPRSALFDAGSGFHVMLRQRPEGPAPAAPGRPSVGFASKLPLAEVVAILDNRGVSFSEAVDDDGVTVAHFEDPDGNALHVYASP